MQAKIFPNGDRRVYKITNNERGRLVGGYRKRAGRRLRLTMEGMMDNRIWNWEHSGFVFADTILGLEIKEGSQIWDGSACLGAHYGIWGILKGGSAFRFESIPVSIKHKSHADVEQSMEGWSGKIARARGSNAATTA